MFHLLIATPFFDAFRTGRSLELAAGQSRKLLAVPFVGKA